jgi:hypothetical protein
MSVLNLGEPTPITVVYEVVRLKAGAWLVEYCGPSRYEAAVAYQDSKPPKRMLAVGRTGGAILHQQPEPTL